MERNPGPRKRGPVTRYPVVITFQTTAEQRERLHRARDTRAINMAKFVRDAVERALDELEGRPAQFARKIAPSKLAAAGGNGQ